MESRQGRSIEVDFFRGVVLIVIVLDHIPGSALSHVMLHAYALCDSAEVFVFLGGYASAAGYMAVRAHRGVSAAQGRFLRRSWEIYRAYLLTALLTLVSGALLALLHLNPAAAELSGWASFATHPVRETMHVVLLARQPWLSSVLPMYVIFALCVPAAVPFARRAPLCTLSCSLLLWAFAPLLAAFVGASTFANWPFDPFAWQLMFVFGMLCRLHPVPPGFKTSQTARWLVRFAFAAMVLFAALKWFVLVQPMPGDMKQHLAFGRVVNFIGIAMVAAYFVHRGTIARIAARLPAVVTVGRTGLVCFVGGTLISVIVDTATPHALHGAAAFGAALAGDMVAIGATLMLARAWRGTLGRQKGKVRESVNGARCG
ncbi:OpgC domain-containing protein [Paraburkholderia acidiphila]|uniref:OpgC domain-containing protein n=1 Tax=Paraburkholderia acidiphila TaxID=2571747 RepID=A0A7Z2GCS4_9BURK|nr:OpgC domain-containing protein [Paraburkholderia acidiphila]QGZ59400.1 OpgC domain-containing protein [Paraburkholderia acidiphila]